VQSVWTINGRGLTAGKVFQNDIERLVAKQIPVMYQSSSVANQRYKSMRIDLNETKACRSGRHSYVVRNEQPDFRDASYPKSFWQSIESMLRIGPTIREGVPVPECWKKIVVGPGK
jgi:hypothetical protein